MPSMVKHTASAMDKALDEAVHTDAPEEIVRTPSKGKVASYAM